MDNERPYVLSIAGFDPSGGAGILADIKTFEANNVLGMGVVSALTFQNDIEFEGVHWVNVNDMLKQVFILHKRFSFNAVKIGLIKDYETVNTIVTLLSAAMPSVRIIWDPIMKASAGFQFHETIGKEKLFPILKKIYLLTPNTDEIAFLSGSSNPMESAQALSDHCNVLLKGGHNESERGTDYLFTRVTRERIEPFEQHVYSKHGSGCVLSSAIAASLAQRNDLITACRDGKKYTEQFLLSNQFLLGTHYAR
jgi:hydroxymethylpyrimidine/phosphomethylpyrimidine kinase